MSLKALTRGLASRPCNIHLLLLLPRGVLNTFVNQFCQRHLGCIRTEMFQIIIENQTIHVDFADTCMNHALCDLVRPFVRAMSDDSYSSIRLLLDRLKSVFMSVNARQWVVHGHVDRLEDSCAWADDVQPSECGDGVVERSLQLRPVQDVCLLENGSRCSVFLPLDHFFGFWGQCEVCDHDIAASLQQFDGEGETDAAPSTRDQ